MQIKATSGSPRERWMLALLPAACIVMLYCLVYNLWTSRESRRLRERLASEEPVREDEVSVLHSRKLAAQRRRDAATQALDAARQALDQVLAEYAAGTAAHQMVMIDQLCRELSITVLSKKQVTSPQLSRVREQSLRTLRQALPAKNFHYRELDIVGRYADIVALLERLPDRVDGVIPVQIEMPEVREENGRGPDSPSQRRWRLLLLL